MNLENGKNLDKINNQNPCCNNGMLIVNVENQRHSLASRYSLLTSFSRYPYQMRRKEARHYIYLWSALSAAYPFMSSAKQGRQRHVTCTPCIYLENAMSKILMCVSMNHSNYCPRFEGWNYRQPCLHNTV